jgi:DNA-directed RNA polymerase specialized sigma24 family protein
VTVPHRSRDEACQDGLGIADIARLYLEFSRPIQRHVGAVVRAPRPIIEDACQFAWSQLLGHRERVSAQTAHGWLTATAIHEAFKLSRAAQREVSLEAALQTGGEQLLEQLVSGPVLRGLPDETAECQEQVAELRTLSLRQQRMLWLNAIGLSRTEVAAHERCTTRTVERQLFKARRALRTQVAEAA